MKIVKPYARIEQATLDLEELIEDAGRICYRSQDKIGPGSAQKFIRNLIQSGHLSVLEHGAITVRFVVDRGVSHELVRHRLASFSQESTRYCNYAQDKFGSEITVIEPCFIDNLTPRWFTWLYACRNAEVSYFQLLQDGCTPQEARSVLPNSLKTELVMTANPREWRHVFELRCSEKAHPQMQEVMIPLRACFVLSWPAIFGDLVSGEPCKS